MADSKRQTVMTAIAAQLATITVANGYETNAGNNVFEHRVVPLELTELPALIYRDTDDVVELTIGEDMHTLSVEVEGVVSGTSSATTMRKLLADIVKAMAADVTFGGVVEDTNVSGETINTEQAEKQLMSVQAEFAVEFTTQHMDPYT